MTASDDSKTIESIKELLDQVQELSATLLQTRINLDAARTAENRACCELSNAKSKLTKLVAPLLDLRSFPPELLPKLPPRVE